MAGSNPTQVTNGYSTCEALLEIFSRTGIPEVIVMDNATNFTASLKQEFLKILGACPRFSTPYHPDENGLIERWNQTLKNMLHHIIREEGRSWHRHIPFLLWAYREVPNATTGTPPFLLMYGRDPKGPLSILKSIWTGNTLLFLNMKGSVESYLKKLNEKIEVATHKAKLTSDIREYRARVQTVGVIYDIDVKFGEIYETSTVPAAEKNDEALDRVTLDYLSKKQQTQLKDLLHRHRTLFSGKIKRAKVGEHVIKLKNEEETMRPKTYKISDNLKRKVDMQIYELLELGLIEPVVSEKAHPVTVYSELCKNCSTIDGAHQKKVFNEIPWIKEAENAFKELKTALCGITELQVPDIEKPYYLHTDASQTAVGCCLGQLDGEDNIHPIAFGSQKLSPSQQKWSTIEMEAYAIIWALKRFEILLCGAKIFLLTDLNPLVFLTSAAPQCPRLQT
ncbi:retrovirus-related Pol polyprotein from transposon 17.6 [Trichonephila clavipes]|nr:retrovirus-related Pol polyprotein from transposon 17.6 [Trichonephila clavipes]